MAALRLIVFDLDGTLIDSRRDLADGANAMLAEYGAPSLDEHTVASMVGSGATTLVKRVLAAARVAAPPDEALARFLRAYHQRLTAYTVPYTGVPEVLGMLERQGHTLAVLTNKPLEPTTRILEAFDLERYFGDRVLGGDGPHPRKPAPDGLRQLMRQAGTNAEETMLVGDSAIDLETARAAGVAICLAAYGFGFEDIAREQLTGAERIATTPAAVAEAAHAHR